MGKFSLSSSMSYHLIISDATCEACLAVCSAHFGAAPKVSMTDLLLTAKTATTTHLLLAKTAFTAFLLAAWAVLVLIMVSVGLYRIHTGYLQPYTNAQLVRLRTVIALYISNARHRLHAVKGTAADWIDFCRYHHLRFRLQNYVFSVLYAPFSIPPVVYPAIALFACLLYAGYHILDFSIPE